MKSLLDKYTPALSIGVVATMVGVSVHTLRLYEKKGLILPFKKKSGRRLYSLHDVNRLKQIRKMIIEQGLNLNGVRSLLSLIPCWNYKGGFDNDCKNCPAAYETVEPCWNIKNVGLKCQNQDCRECPVYQMEINHERLKEVFNPEINTIIKQMKD
jgi:MerR family transcriptional regulator/heat shock protein HspR